MSQNRVLGKRILVADDERSVRDALRLLLRIDNHIVSEASNGQEALDLYAPERFDLVITDLEMPVIKGNELAATIKRQAPAQRILMITAFAGKISDRENPVDALLSKPFTFADLREAIARLLKETG